MGYEILSQRYRADFPVTQHLTYLNHAAVAPLCRPAAEAMKHLAEDNLLHGSYHYDRWMATYEGLRAAAARMIGASPREIAIVKNTSEGIVTVAQGIGWRPGDTLVAFEEEFPANWYPWKRLEAKGVRVVWLPLSATLDQIEAAARGARLLSISFVQYLSGFRADLDAIGAICERHGALFFVDAIQGMGAFPMDVRRSKIHALAADGHKWLLGPEGCGVLYVQQDVQDEIEPFEFGYTNVARYADYGTRDMTLRPDAGRYECGTLNTIGCYGLRAAMDFINEIGVERIGPAVQALGDRIACGARTRGFEVLGPERTPQTGAGIVSFRHPRLDSRQIVQHLRDRGFITAPRQGWVRVSPHFYISAEDVDRMLEALPKAG